jgi:uncharacterized protein
MNDSEIDARLAPADRGIGLCFFQLPGGVMYEQTVPVFKSMLTNLDNILQKAAAHAEARKFDFSVLLQSRLAPDQLPLIAQVMIACDVAKGCVGRMSGKEIPKHEDTETTLPELRERIRKTIAFIETAQPGEFQNGPSSKQTVPWMPGKYIEGAAFLHQVALPNFYFHVTTAYAILRHNGVALGKADFLGAVDFKDL